MAAGEKMKNLLEKLTNSKIKGAIVGLLVTCIIQSSSATTVTLVGLINAHLISLAQAVPVIMGANIGTTITAQLVAFRLDEWALPMVAVGFVMFFTAKSEKIKYFGQVLMGFGILFVGLKFMASEVKQLAKDPDIVLFLAKMGRTPILAVLTSMIFTEIIQSSSATTGLIIAMGMSGLIDLQTAICFILGANIGTTITVCIAAFGPTGSTYAAKRTALAHVLFNVIGNLCFLPFIGYYAEFISRTSSDIARQIANSHTFFNVTMTCILLPLSGYLIKLVTFIIKGEDITIETGVKFLDKNTLKTPAIALNMAINETERMANIALSMLESSRKAFFEGSKTDISLVKEKEKLVDDLDNKIENFIMQINDNALSAHQKNQLSSLNLSLIHI